ncbi:src like-proteiny-3 domain [Fusarium flagelliforme]|uniref:Src like-proteiny-3 domain n=1 Tax=Fusarium flagelliforme TaxID=2675880 RepID=A0A395MLL3_9HYPO|nr:src like-proteiny-3 domain [Fusarium flagelliforme]
MAEPQPPHEEGTVLRKDYLKTAFESLEEGTKKGLKDLRERFDEKTKKAIDDLIKKKPDGVPKETLSETKNILKALRHHDYQKLTIQEKGNLQRWALKKRLDSNTVEELSNIKAKHQSQGDTEAGANHDISMSLDDLLLVCGDQKKVDELKKKVFKFLGKEINYTPSGLTAGLVWGIFKVLLQFAVISEKGVEAPMSGIQTTVDVMQRAATYQKYIYDPSGHSTLDQSEIDPFEGCLISTYQRIFKFLVIASKCFTESKVTLWWYVFWNEKDILEFEQDIFKYEQKLFQDATIKSLIDQGSKASIIHDLVKAMNARILGTQESMVEVLSQQSGITIILQSLQSKVDDIQTLIMKNCPNVERDEMLGWFSKARVEDHHRTAKDQRTIDTAEWVLKKQQYLAWSSDSGSSLLWIKGISGAGKTTIISRLVDTYHESAENEDSFAQPHVAYFYCKRDAADRRFSEDIFRSFIRQLASAYHPLPGKLVQTYRVKSPKSSLSTQLYEEDYEGLLIELIPRTTETVLILDALDECVGQDTRSSGEIGKVLKTLKRLLDTELPIKIVVASRYEKRIKHDFNGKHMIEISADDNSNDIKKMVLARINDYNLTDPEVRINQDLEEKILKVFNDKSQGKFQWATLHIDHLLDGLTDGILLGAFAVEETLGQLPEGLVDTYSEIFHRINTKLHKSQKETAFRVLKWLLAMGTCDEKVLIAAICQRLEGQPGDYPNRVEGNVGHILTACQHLVTIQDSKFRFSHLSVQEYLESHQSEFVDTCHYDVAKVCASVLFRYRTAEGATEPWAYYCQKVKFSLPLLSTEQHSSMNELWHFACNQWYNHFDMMISPAQREDIGTIVDNSFPSSFATWLTVRVTGLTKLKESSVTAPDRSLFGIFRYNQSREFQSFWGVPLGAQLWAKSLDVLPESNKKLGFQVVVDTAFSCGIINKLQRLVKRQMTLEMSLDAYEDRPQDSQRLLDRLFQSMMEPESERAKRLMYGSANSVVWARRLFDLADATNGWEDFLALCKTFMNWRQTMLGTADRTMEYFEKLFSFAPQQDQGAEQCYRELARLTLLCICLTGDKELGDFLFNRFPHASTIRYYHLVPPVGFDMDLALARAATGSDSRYIDLLLSHGANKSAATKEGTPLMAALSHERIENAEVLLQAGADMNGVNLNPIMGYGNITIMACSVQDPGLFQLLRKHDAINIGTVAQTGTCLTPLIAACRYGHIDRVNLLLSMGVNFNESVTTGRYANALCAAVEGQSMRAIRQLLRQLLRQKISHSREDALDTWRKNQLEVSTPDYSVSISKKCQALLSWLIVPILQHRHEEGSRGNDTSVTGFNRIEGRRDEVDDFLWDGNDDSNEEDAFSEDGSEGYGYGATNHGEDERDRGDEPEQKQEEGYEHHRTDIHSEGMTDSNLTILRTARRHDGDVTAPNDYELLKNISNIISWLHQHCVQEPQVVQRELARTFGFSLPEHNDSTGAELVRNALLKGFQNVVRLTHKHCSLDDITTTWQGFLDLAEDAMGLNEEVERLANGGV